MVRSIVRALHRVDESARAREWQLRLAEAERSADLDDLRAFERALACDATSERILLGRARHSCGDPSWVGMELRDLLSSHVWITGSTGSGKTFLAMALVMQLLERPDVVLTLLDMKGEFSDFMRSVMIPVLSTTNAGPRVLENLRIVRPFDRDYLPQLRVTAREEGVSREVQAHAITASIQEALGDDLGARMNRICLRLTNLAIELGESLTVVKNWLEDPRRLIEAARRSRDPDSRSYAAGAFAQESRPAREALLARLDTFFMLAETRLALSAPTCFSFAEALEGGLTIIDLGDPPAGAEAVTRFWAGILVGRMMRAILSRRVDERSPRAVFLLEEWQEGMQRHNVESFSRLLALARYKKVSLWFLNQQAAQVARVEPALLRLLRTNTGIEAAFRCNLEDAKALAHAIPVTDTTRPLAHVRAELTSEMTRLPNRTFYFWWKEAPFGARRLRSPRLDLHRMRRQADTIPEDIASYIRQGTVSIRRDELERHVAAGRAATADAGDPDPFLELSSASDPTASLLG